MKEAFPMLFPAPHTLQYQEGAYQPKKAYQDMDLFTFADQVKNEMRFLKTKINWIRVVWKIIFKNKEKLADAKIYNF